MSEAQRRGRPVAVVPAYVAFVALQLFEAQGYDETSMEQVSVAAGVSRRSLFNHFSSKADLVWFGLEPFARAFCSLLDGAPADETVRTTVERCQLAAVLELGEDLDSVRARTRIIYHHPELGSDGSSGYATIRAALQRFVARRLALPEGHVAAFVLADTITAQMASAFAYWAVHTTHESPAETLHEATQALVEVFTRH